MAATYKAIGWNRHKRIYDIALIAGITLFLGSYMALGPLWAPNTANTNPEMMLISALGACAFLMLHILLCIGPMARLWPCGRFLLRSTLVDLGVRPGAVECRPSSA